MHNIDGLVPLVIFWIITLCAAATPAFLFGYALGKLKGRRNGEV